MIFEPKVVIKTIMRLFTRIVALKIITEYVNINNMYTQYIKEISPPIGPSVWFFLNVSDEKIIATVARYYSISQFLIFLRPKRTKFI